jgi:NADH:ubiquinone oxidoreductase subunit 2 (subunit N)
MPTSIDFIRFLPEIILTVAGTLLMVLDPVLNKRSSHAFGHLSLLALLATGGTMLLIRRRKQA